MNIILGVLIAIIIVALTIIILLNKRTLYLLSGLKSVPGPPYNPIFGNIYNLLPTKDAMLKSFALHSKYGKTFTLYIPGIVSIITIDLAFVEHILTAPTSVNKSTIYYYLQEWLGEGLLLSQSDKWRSRRKTLTPAFHFKVLEGFLDVFNKNAKIFVGQLEKSMEKHPSVDVFHYGNLCALDNIIETSMGSYIGCQINNDLEIVQATKFMGTIPYRRSTNPLKVLNGLYSLTADRRKEKKCLKILHDHTLSIIKSKREKLSESGQFRENIDNFGIKKKMALVDLLLQFTNNGEPLSDLDIQEELDTFMFAGHDTVSSSLSFALHCISEHPEIQAKLIEEQYEIFGNEFPASRYITNEDINKMSYLEMVIKETLRLFPPVPGVGRVAMEDFHYKDLHIREGTNLMVTIREIHRDPDNYPDPEKFDPERFLPEMQSKRHPYAYIPFSFGQRNCIGLKFGMMELKTLISHVLRNFELTPTVPAHKIVIQSAAVLHSTTGVYIHLKKRKF